jgi:transcription elongation GreA/GreB family factor
MTEQQPTVERLLPHEKAFALGAFTLATANSKQAKLDYGEAVGSSGGDWVFDDPASQAALQEAGLKGVTERFYKQLVRLDVMATPDNEQQAVSCGSRATVQIGKYVDKYDIVTRRIPGLPQDDDVFALLSAHSAMGQAIIGAKTGDTITWSTEDGRSFEGTINAVDQISQSAYYEKLGYTLPAHE